MHEWLDTVLLAISQAGQLLETMNATTYRTSVTATASSCCANTQTLINRCVALACWLVYRRREPAYNTNSVTVQILTLYCRITSLAAAMPRAEQKGSAPHDLDSDGTQVAGVKGLLQGTHLIQHTSNSPHICLAIICLALHSAQT